jgi:hypothetical protein
MRINKKVETEIADQFESALAKISALDKVPYHIKDEAAVFAAKEAFAYIKREMS